MSNDIPYAVPASVSVVFPRPTGVGSYVVPVTLVSLALPEFAGVVGAPAVKVVRDNTPAPDDGMGGASNAGVLAALAAQAAADWYLWQLGRAEARWEGVDPWLMEAHTEVVEFRHETGRVTTRTTRGPLLDHYAGQLPAPPVPAYVLVLAAPVGGVPYRGVLSAPTGFAWEDASSVVDARAINDETLSVGDRYEGRLVGYTAAGVPEYRVVATCCPGGSSGSGSGGVIAPCCPGIALPHTLYASGPFGVITLTLDLVALASGSVVYVGGSGTVCPGLVHFRCIASGNFWTLNIDYSPSSFSMDTATASSATCSPFSVTFPITEAAGACTAPPYTVTITATNPGGGGGGGSDCFAGACGSAGAPATLTATVTSATGCLATGIAPFTLTCFPSTGGRHFYQGTFSPPACGTNNVNIYAASGPPVLKFPSIPALATTADAGYSCSPPGWVFHVNDGAGNSCVITVS